MRLLVRKHNRLPEFFVVDRGSEFRSTYFEVLCANFGTNKKTRPTDDPRAGNLVESLFGVVNAKWVHNQLGNTKIMKNVRQVTRTTNPKALAKLNILQIQQNLEEWAETYNAKKHPALGMSPNDAYKEGLLRGGERPESVIPYDQAFMDWILPTTPKGTAKVFPGAGLKINNITYSAPELRRPDVEKTTVGVRYDPWDIGYIKAFVKGKWVICSSKYSTLHGRSEADLRRVSEEVRKKSRIGQITQWQIAGAFKKEDKDPEKALYKLRSQEIRCVNDHVTGQVATGPAVATLPRKSNAAARNRKARLPENTVQPADIAIEQEQRESREFEQDDSKSLGEYETLIDG
jgi:hypothetical protein